MFEQLDYIYTPSGDVAADVAFFRDRLGARVVFTIDSMGTRVAMVELTEAPPRIVFAGHLAGDRPLLVYRVADIEAAERELAERGCAVDTALEIPQGPVRTFVFPGGQRLAVYQLTRPGVIETFAGRRDF